MDLLEDSQIVAQHYKLNIDGIIGWISSKGVKMIKPMEVSSEQFNGLDWNINKVLEENLYQYHK